MTDTSTAPVVLVESEPAQNGSGTIPGMRDIVNPATGAVIATSPSRTPATSTRPSPRPRPPSTPAPWPRCRERSGPGCCSASPTRSRRTRRRLYTLEAANNGRPITETRAQLSRVPEWFRYNAGLLAAQRQAVLPSDGPYLTYQQRRPLGVCGIITPFNHPLLILARSLSAALANGNTVVVKPSELTPLTTLALVDIMTEAGLPDGVVNVVTGGREAGHRLTQHPDVAKITLTGGTEAGRAAALATAARFARVTAELGRQDPGHRVRRRRPGGRRRGRRLRRLRRRRPILRRRFTIPGAARRSTTRSSPRWRPAPRAIRIGDPTLPDTQMGPLISAASGTRCTSSSTTGIAEGARLAAGGGSRICQNRCGTASSCEPTVLADATMDMTRRAGGDLRPGRRRHPVRRRGRRRADGQRQPLRPRRRRVDHRHRPSATASRPASSRAWCGSTITTASNRRCRGAG